jgi:hypothetical protein
MAAVKSLTPRASWGKKACDQVNGRDPADHGTAPAPAAGSRRGPAPPPAARRGSPRAGGGTSGKSARWGSPGEPHRPEVQFDGVLSGSPFRLPDAECCRAAAACSAAACSMGACSMGAGGPVAGRGMRRGRSLPTMVWPGGRPGEGGRPWPGSPGRRARDARAGRHPGRRGRRRRRRLAEGRRDQRVELRIQPLRVVTDQVRERRACLAGG